MGVIKDIVNQVDKSEEEKAKLGETLNLLVSLAESKAEHCQSIIESDLRVGRVIENDTLYFPITHIAEKRIQYRCITTDTPGDLVPTIANSIMGMYDEHTPKNIINSIAKTVNEFLKVLIGSCEGTEQYAQVYTTGIDGSGMAMSLVRTDFMFWCRKITASSLKEKMDSALVCVAYKSVIDVSKLKFDDFRNVYSKVVDNGLPEDLTVLDRKKVIIQCIQDAKQIFEILGGQLDNCSERIMRSSTNVVNLKLGKIF